MPDEPTFYANVNKGRRFEAWDRAQWTGADHAGIQFEHPTQHRGKRGRIDIRLPSETSPIASNPTPAMPDDLVEVSALIRRHLRGDSLESTSGNASTAQRAWRCHPV